MKATLDAVMQQVSTLNRFGADLSNIVAKAERATRLAASRQALGTSTARVEQICEWIDTHLRPSKRINGRYSSYGLKHVAEADLGYVANGEFIAAMLMCGYRHQPCGPNAWFNVSSASVKAVVARLKGEGKGVLL